MSIIALTGGIGSGKSEVAKQFALLGVPIVDTDLISHELTTIGEPTLLQIQQVFGKDFFEPDGNLNRIKLRTHIFTHANERHKLEAILHPAIRARVISRLAENKHQLNPDYQMIVVPLLFENNQYAAILAQTLVVDCDERLQIERAMARSHLTEPEVLAIMNAQVSRSERLKLADEIIENNGTIKELSRNVAKIHKKFVKTCIVSK